MYSAGAAQGDSAAIFRAGYPKLVSQHPKQRHVLFDIHLMQLTVDLQAQWDLPNAAALMIVRLAVLARREMAPLPQQRELFGSDRLFQRPHMFHRHPAGGSL